MVHTDPPVMGYTQGPLCGRQCSHYTYTLGVTFYIQVGVPTLDRASIRGPSGCWILHTLCLLRFTTTVM